MATSPKSAMIAITTVLLLGCKSKEAPSAPRETAPSPPASSVAVAPPPSLVDSGVVAGALADLPYSTRAQSDESRGLEVYLSRTTLQIDADQVPLESFATVMKLGPLIFANDTDAKNLAIAPVVAAAQKARANEATVYAHSWVPYLALGQVFTSLALANVSTLHLAVKGSNGGTRTLDLAVQNGRPADDDAGPVASVFVTFVRIRSRAKTCEASMARDPWDLKELVACAAAVKKAAGPGQDTIVLVPGMGETTSTLVSILDALVASFPQIRIVPDGDILRGRAAKEELARRDAQQRKKK